MASIFRRPVEIDRHPVVEQKYILPTPSIEEMYLRVKKLIRLRTPGGIIFAHPRFGKTYSIRYVARVLREDFPKAVILSFGCQKKKAPSEDAFFTVLLQATSHAGAHAGSVSKKRSKLNDRIKELVDRSGHNWFVMFADEAQRLDVIQYEWLRDVHDDLERIGIRMITLLVGQPSLLNRKSSFMQAGEAQIVTRFMIDELQFHALRSAEDFATCLAGYDVACFPEGSGWTYTQFFLPAAYSSGFRLVKYASMLWSAFSEAHLAARFAFTLEVPMQYFARSVEIVLLENFEGDDHDFTLTPEMWKRAIAESNFVAAQSAWSGSVMDELEVED